MLESDLGPTTPKTTLNGHWKPLAALSLAMSGAEPRNTHTNTPHTEQTQNTYTHNAVPHDAKLSHTGGRWGRWRVHERERELLQRGLPLAAAWLEGLLVSRLALGSKRPEIDLLGAERPEIPDT